MSRMCNAVFDALSSRQAGSPSQTQKLAARKAPYFLPTTMANPDIFLIVTSVVAFIILAVVAVYILINYQHPDDKNEAYFPKFVVVIGIMMAGFTAFLLPLDVANNDNYAGT